VEYSLGDQDPPASTLRPSTTTTAQRPPPPPPPPTAAKRAPPPPPTATLKRVPPPRPPVAKALTTLKAAQVLAGAKALTTLKAAATTTPGTATAKEEDELCADLLPDVDVQNSDFVQWARCNPTLYNDKSTTNLVRQSFGNTDKYTKQQKDAVNRLLMILLAHPEQRVRDLAEPVTDKVTGITVPKFIHLTHNRKTAAGKIILNTVMVLFGLNVSFLDKSSGQMMDIHSMTAEAIAKIQFMPSTMKTMYKQVFSYFNQNGICYQQKEFKGMQGSFHVSLLCCHCHSFYPHPLTSYCLSHHSQGRHERSLPANFGISS
jgi:hypothetical protein